VWQDVVDTHIVAEYDDPASIKPLADHLATFRQIFILDLRLGFKILTAQRAVMLYNLKPVSLQGEVRLESSDVADVNVVILGLDISPLGAIDTADVKLALVWFFMFVEGRRLVVSNLSLDGGQTGWMESP